MNFDDAYNYLLAISNLPHQEYMNTPEHCEAYLKRIQFFLDILGNPEKKIPHYIHVTGTSGKGSVTLMLQSILHAAGKKVGCTLSPHPSVITERWQIGNKPMPKKDFADVMTVMKDALDMYVRNSPYDMVSFHDLINAMTFYYYAKKKLDWVVLEVGCGGRYDSTNVIPHKDAAIITNIGLDHTHILGDTKEKIAYDKVGIVTNDTCGVFTMERNKKILNVIEKECTQQVSKCSSVQVKQQTIDGLDFTYKKETYFIPTLGKHQAKNAVLCIDVAKSLGIEDTAIRKGLRNVRLPVRMEVVSQSPTIILDSAHNPDKMKSSTNTLLNLQSQVSNLHLLLGFSDNKDISKMLRSLATLNPKSIACTRNTVNHFRKVADPKKLADMCKKYMPKAKTFVTLDPKVAFDWSMKQTTKRDILLVTGSVFISGELRPLLTK